MKTVIIWIILLGGLVGTIIFLLAQHDGLKNPFATGETDAVLPTTQLLTFDQATVYTCTDGGVVAAAFKTGDTTVLELSLPASNPVVLTATEATSGAKYSSPQGILFWENAGTAFVEKDGEIIFTDCKRGQMTDTIPTATSTNELTGTKWVWVETTFATGTAVTPNKPNDFILTFAENNRFSANTDCNNAGGGFVGGTAGAVTFGEMVSTLMACEGDTKEAVFVDMLSKVVSYRVSDTKLVLSLKSDDENGEMIFSAE